MAQCCLPDRDAFALPGTSLVTARRPVETQPRRKPRRCVRPDGECAQTVSAFIMPHVDKGTVHISLLSVTSIGCMAADLALTIFLATPYVCPREKPPRPPRRTLRCPSGRSVHLPVAFRVKVGRNAHNAVSSTALYSYVVDSTVSAVHVLLGEKSMGNHPINGD